MIKLSLTVSDAQAIVRALDHLRWEAGGTGKSSYTIDTLCRVDCRARWLEIKQYIESRLPKEAA